jgi:hypothetical protein
MWRIKHWDSIYENAATRKLKNLAYVLVPNKHDGKGFRRLARRTDAAEVYAAWILMLQVASKSPLRGMLVDSEGELTAADLADKTCFPEAIFENAFNVLSDKAIGWIEDVSLQKSPNTLGDEPNTLGDTGSQSGANGTERNERNGTERKKETYVRSSDFDLRNKASEVAAKIADILWPDGRGKTETSEQKRKRNEDNALLWKLSCISLTDAALTNEWLTEAAKAATNARNTRVGYLKGAALKMLRQHGRDLHEMLNAIRVPSRRRKGELYDA